MAKHHPEDFLPLESQWFHILAALASGEQKASGDGRDVFHSLCPRFRVCKMFASGSSVFRGEHKLA